MAKWTIDSIIDWWKELLKEWEQKIEDMTWEHIDLFTDEEKITPEIEKKAGEKETTKETKNELVDLKSDVVLTKIKKQLSNWFNEFEEKINNVSSVFLNDNEKKEHIKTAKKEYNELMKMLDSYKNDWDFKKWYDKVNTKIADWLIKLEKQESNDIVNNVKLSLETLQIDMEEINWKSKEDIQKRKDKVQEKYNDTEEKDENKEIKTMLTKFWVPAWLAGAVAWLLAWIWFWKEEKWYFTQALDFIKDPVNWFLWIFWLWKDKKENAEAIKKWVISKSWKNSTYKNEDLEIKLKWKELKSIEIDWDEYKLNIENLSDFSFEQNDKDILKIWGKKIDLFSLIKQTKEEKEDYLVYEDFDNSKDLKLEKI